MERLTLSFEIKQFSEQNDFFRFEGFASTFGNLDLDNDVILPGAFRESLKKRTPVLLWQHKTGEPIGMPEEIFEDENGLILKGVLPKADDLVRGRIIPQMKIGSIKSMSIGFNIPTEGSFVENGIRFIKTIELFEVSLVTFPANPMALVSGFKTVIPFQDLPLAERDRAWDSSAALSRVRTFTDSTETPSRSYRRAFLWFDSNAPENFGSYKLPIADVINGRLTAVPRGVFAANAALAGARGGVDIPDSDRPRVQANVDRYLRKIEDEQPLESDDEKPDHRPEDMPKNNGIKMTKFTVEDIDDIETTRELEKFLKNSGFFTSKAAKTLISKFADVKRDVKSVKNNDEKKNRDDSISTDLWDVGDINEELKGLAQSLRGQGNGNPNTRASARSG